MKSSKHLYCLSLALKEKIDFSVETLLDALVQVGVDLSEIVEEETRHSRRLRIYFTDKRCCQATAKKIKALREPRGRVSVRTLTNRDWKDKWKESFRPFSLTDRLMIVPAWRKRGYRPRKRKALYIDTDLAFGTGLHETTKLAAALIEENCSRMKTLLDVGTGSGILSVAAHLLGVSEIDAVDIDRRCLKIARQNMSVNGGRFNHLIGGDLLSLNLKKKYDGVVANIITHELLKIKPKLIPLIRPGGYLIISGVSQDNFNFFKENFFDQRLRCLRIKKGKEWAAFLFKRKIA